MGAGLRFIQKTGQENISAHEHMLMEILKEGLLMIPTVVVHSAKHESIQIPVLSFNISGYTPGEIGAILDQAFDIKVRTGLHCSPETHKSLGTFPQGTVRISPGCFNTSDDIDLIIQAVRKIARQTG